MGLSFRVKDSGLQARFRLGVEGSGWCCQDVSDASTCDSSYYVFFCGACDRLGTNAVATALHRIRIRTQPKSQHS